MEFSTVINTAVRTSKRLMMWLLLAMTLLGCSKQSNSNASDLEKNFSTLIPVTDMNESLHLVVDGEEISFALGERIKLKVLNQSPHFLSFDHDTHIRLLASPDLLQWVDVKNAMTYSGELQLAPKGTILLDFKSTYVKPVLDVSSLSPEQKDIPLRIVLVGEIMEKENRTGEKVGAYVDVILKP